MGACVKFPEWLRDSMEAEHYTQSDVARLVNTSQSNVSMWLRGKSIPSVENLVALSRLFRYDHLKLMEMIGIVASVPNLPTGEEQQVIDKLALFRDEKDYRAIAHAVITFLDLLGAGRDAAGDTLRGERHEEA